jgi:mono/diheme cytochrome c family protein
MRSENTYQIALISLGIAATALFGYFLYDELFPEYRIYQNDYVALENFRSTYTGEPSPIFKEGIKQLVLEREDRGPPVVDRCISCHVALEYTHFSPTKIAKDANGKVEMDSQGMPIQVPNEEYVWDRLDKEIEKLMDAKVLEQLASQGKQGEITKRTKEAEKYKALKTAYVDRHTYDVTKVLRMHPLMGKETRPFEFHPIEEYGCTSCHNGNGKGITTETAHGPVFDERYETEFMGHKPEFLEEDPANDPLFSKVFNSKPGHELLFQTTPLYVGGLIQAKCVQCHQVSSLDTPKEDEGTQQQVDLLTTNYRRGQQLFISQACYACHRIAGYSRGGVGPELTQEGKSYPWFVKESIVWPQADLKTSTMPNYHMDHLEVEDLMTYLLGQEGPSKALSATAYKAGLLQWEAGRKLPWEKPISPAQMDDLRFSMTVFATEGCAACHRLKGFESNVGFAIEKDNPKVDFESLYREKEWFSKLFPESIQGSALVTRLDANRDEIDKRIVNDVRTDSILENIEKEHPHMIEALYSNFKFAERAKNAHFRDLAAKEKDPVRQQEILAELKQWKQRVHRVLMLFIQEYGLGRMVGPRPNWSGIYRSDEWLMEHFHNPGGHVARSIMPVFPFDDTKFYALTHMLDALGIRNRDEVRTIWENRGFSPELAYNIHCAQCHGDYLQGNGPVSEWIYPIPKNLRNGEFLRNLTKERVIQSIAHGVQGTPMSPWGEVGQDKVMATGDIPVLKQEEIAKLADWLFSNLPGGNVKRNDSQVPKWKYMPEDVIEELKNEGNVLEPEKHAGLTKPLAAELSALPTGKGLYASLTVPVANSGNDVREYFDVVPNPIPGAEKEAYYIKKEFYTPENIESGKRFFELNCAVCHGKDADGSGMRAGSMIEAKPRMLTNLDWINTRDDLRLLRSIKYGVNGTSMTPWGDMTSSLQRLQLVMFIRSLSEGHEERNSLLNALYQAFDTADLAIERTRTAISPAFVKLNNELTPIQNERIAAYAKAEEGVSPSKEGLDSYQKELVLLEKISHQKAIDNLLLNLKAEIKREKDLYQKIGESLIIALGSDGSLETLIKALNLLDKSYQFKDGQLIIAFDPEKNKEIEGYGLALKREIEKKIQELDQRKVLLNGQFASAERAHQLTEVKAEILTLNNLKKQVERGFKQAAESRVKQEESYKQFKMLFSPML